MFHTIRWRIAWPFVLLILVAMIGSWNSDFQVLSVKLT